MEEQTKTLMITMGLLLFVIISVLGHRGLMETSIFRLSPRDVVTSMNNSFIRENFVDVLLVLAVIIIIGILLTMPDFQKKTGNLTTEKVVVYETFDSNAGDDKGVRPCYAAATQRGTICSALGNKNDCAASNCCVFGVYNTDGYTVEGTDANTISGTETAGVGKCVPGTVNGPSIEDDKKDMDFFYFNNNCSPMPGKECPDTSIL
jgi:hypothetical protein